MKTMRLALPALLLLATPAGAQVKPLLGQIMPTAATFCPAGWLDAHGQILNIAQNTALFALFGTNFGGNGQTTFAIPNLSGRAAGHTGTGPGLPSTVLGEEMGEPATTLTADQIPAHSHTYNASQIKPNVKIPTAALLPTFPAAQPAYATTAPSVQMAKEAIAPAGGGMPFDQYQPSLVLRYCVAVVGDFPKRN